MTLRVVPSSALHRLSARVESNAESWEIFLESDAPLVRDATPWIALQLPLAMHLGNELRIAGSVDSLALANVERAQDVLRAWYPDLTRISVRAENLSETTGPLAAGVGCFFSGGVDSFYSVFKHRERVSHLIFVAGLDIRLDDSQLLEAAISSAREVADALHKTLIVLRTNVRTQTDGRLDWGYHCHGAVLGAIGVALAEHVGEVIIPASYTTEDLHPWGSHPELDRWWSSSRVRLTHDGVEASRPAKVAAISQDQIALDYLRVCWRNPDSQYNCGRCEKCLRTMLNLRSVDALQRSRTLPKQLDARAVRKMRLSEGGDMFANENLAALRSLSPRDRQLERALRQAQLVSRALRPIAQARRKLRTLTRFK